MAQNSRKPGYELVKGFFKENPVLVQLLGICSVLAVSNTVVNSISMGVSVLFVLFFSSLVIGLIKDLIPNEVRIPAYIVVIATFVTVADLFLKAKFPDISKALGAYIPLIVVNCIILARQEAFTKKNKLLPSILDAIGMGTGYIITILLMGIIREILGFGSIFGVKIFGSWFKPILVMILPPGAFLTLAMLIGFMNFITRKSEEKKL
ncbi:MAG TPA: electron transport complex subunit RsxE [Candidatus Hydrothermia bacterium]|nr:electron transport complex subunit RsxE [Candidatus Hydrothermae bacterium]MDD3648959.1 electron transport complex subunit RsxE [Candidatus Hydrothermia bacterium]MDD5573174.1 electron transport complex subunit RsxE [Candidatus Hydrothermia bacterium]HOK23200.1 electron transport complex subunit RsxE [Candidatus Hydrothermia bacterium]HOL23904.1 electron transport complex subunit RsxE [Candidatus Hydrothermia bacterium]